MKTHTRTLAICLSVIGGFQFTAFAQNIEKTLIKSYGKERAYYLFVPEKLDAAKPVPLVVLLHGSGRNGMSLAEKWKDLAKKERFIIAGPDASDLRGWAIPADGPAYIYELVESLKGKYPVDAKRVYLFGHSAGAGIAIYFSLLESEYFAATAIHAGALPRSNSGMIDEATRKIPFSIFIGTDDRMVPVAAVRSTKDALTAAGFTVDYHEMNGHTHDYYGKSNEINSQAWEFLKKYELKAEPNYVKHNFR
ncbi:MAG: PHB depolymerase family esterase [Pyrinomonadaceae bacterium]